jgi:hypothetical protein
MGKRVKHPGPWTVEWRDSHAWNGGWRPAKAYLGKRERDPRMFSVGFVLADDKKGIVLANSIDPTLGTATEVIAIPRGAIVSRRRLK